jgi:hypothetical protein
MTIQRSAIQSSTQCHSVVARNRLHIHLVEQTGTHQFAVCGAIQGDATGKGEFTKARLLSEARANMKNDSFEAFLKRRGHVLMRLRDFFLLATPLNQIGIEEISSCQIVFTFLACFIQAEARNANGSIRPQFYRRFKK